MASWEQPTQDGRYTKREVIGQYLLADGIVIVLKGPCKSWQGHFMRWLSAPLRKY